MISDRRTIANIKEKMKSEVKQLIKILPCVSKQMVEDRVSILKTEKDTEN